MASTISSGRAGGFDPRPLACEEPDEGEIKRFYHHYRPLLERFARREGSADPEGIADLAFFDGLRAADNMISPTEASFRAYLYQAARSRIASEKRRRSFDLGPLGDAEGDRGAASDTDPADLVADTALVEDLLDTLTAEQRRVIHHRFYLGHSTVETADRVGKSPGAVRKLQHDAIARLRRTVALVGAAALAIALAVGVYRAHADDGHRLVVDGPVDQPLSRRSSPDPSIRGGPPVTAGPPTTGPATSSASAITSTTVTATTITATTITATTITATTITPTTITPTTITPTTITPTTGPTTTTAATQPLGDDDDGEDDGDD